jgi:hypothetical protein
MMAIPAGGNREFGYPDPGRVPPLPEAVLLFSPASAADLLLALRGDGADRPHRFLSLAKAIWILAQASERRKINPQTERDIG